MTSAAGAEDRDALLGAARRLRAAGRLPDALGVLGRLATRHPRFGRQYEERGHCHLLRGDGAAAVAALRRAVELNPALPASWDMLARLHRLRGEAVAAAEAARQAALLDRLPPAVVVANSLLVDGDLQPAEAVLRRHLADAPGEAGALRLLARICLQRDAPDEAERVLERLLTLAPDYHAARADYALLLLDRRRPAAARAETARLLAHDPASRDTLKQHAAACLALGDHAAAAETYARLLAGTGLAAAERGELHLWRANALKATGRLDAAVAGYRAALDADPGQAVAWFALANLKLFRFADVEVDAMRTALAAAPPGMDRVYLHFALGKAAEDGGGHATAWRHYAAGNALRRCGSRYRPAAMAAGVRRLRETFTADFFAARAGWGLDEPAPIFVVGLPRSGSTLVEQILASHPAVEATHELTELDALARDLCGVDPACGLPADPAAVAALTAPQVRDLAERFLAETRPYRRLGRLRFVDKMPNDFWHVGLIHLLLPRAGIVDVRRAPLACCFGNFKQLFGTDNHEFSYNLHDLAGHYRAYLDLMRHWDRVLPGRVLRLHHEDVVDDLPGSVRRLLDHLGLPFAPACLRFHETARDVRSPSAAQVRQPLSRDGLTQWRAFAPWLAPLQAALGDALATYRE